MIGTLTFGADANAAVYRRNARAAVDEEKIVIALKTLCSEREWVGALLGWMSR